MTPEHIAYLRKAHAKYPTSHDFWEVLLNKDPEKCFDVRAFVSQIRHHLTDMLDAVEELEDLRANMEEVNKL